jgi:hypothetical protein
VTVLPGNQLTSKIEARKMEHKRIFITLFFIILLAFSMNGFSQISLELLYSFNLAVPDTRGGIYVDDTWIWLADHKNGLWRARKCDGSDSSDTSGDDAKIWDLDHSSNYFYAPGEKALFIYDDINGALLGSVATSDKNAKPVGIYVAGNYAYLAGAKGIEIYNISDPYNPSFVRSIDSGNEYAAVRGFGDYIYANQSSDNIMLIYDISTTPDNPTLRGTFNPGMSGEIRRSYADEEKNRVYLINDAADLYIVDVSNPDAPTQLGSIFLPGGDTSVPAGGVYVEGDNAMVTTSDGNDKGYLYWLNVSDPTNITIVDSKYDTEFGFNSPYIHGCYVMIAAHDGYIVYATIGYQPDGLISNIDESNYIGNAIYNETGVNQTKSQQINYGDSAIYKIRIENESSVKQQIKVEGQNGANGWSYIYLDENNIDITADILNDTFLTDSLEYSEFTVLTLIVLPDETVLSNTIVNDSITVSASGCLTGDCIAPELDVMVANVTLLNGPSSIGDYVWHDADSDAIQDFSENGIANVYMSLLTTTGDTVATTTTNSNGLYTFWPLRAGDYYVHVKDGSLPPFYWTTTNNDPMLVNLSPGEDFVNADFGYNELQSSEYDPTGFIYDEVSGEIIPGGLITANGPGQITYLKDGSSGNYSFYTDGTPGLYTITLTLPPGYMLSTICLPSDPPPFDPTGQSNPVILGNGENGTTGYLTSNTCTTFYYTFDLEDGDPYIINNNFPLKKMLYDFGDAPDPTYPTLSISNGANHFIVDGYFLGSSVDDETDGQPDASSLGDDNDGNDDDDGVIFSSP